jgi:hypothetical protein
VFSYIFVLSVATHGQDSSGTYKPQRPKCICPFPNWSSSFCYSLDLCIFWNWDTSLPTADGRGWSIWHDGFTRNGAHRSRQTGHWPLVEMDRSSRRLRQMASESLQKKMTLVISGHFLRRYFVLIVTIYTCSTWKYRIVRSCHALSEYELSIGFGLTRSKI